MRKRYNHKPSIKCLECGRKFVRPMSHVWQVHGMSAREYKELHGLDVKRGIATEAYREVMREHNNAHRKVVVEQNLLTKGKQSRFKKGDDTNYVRSKQTMKRLKKHWVENVAPKSWQKKKAETVTKPCSTCGTDVTRTKSYAEKYNKLNTYCSRSCATIGNNKGRATK